MLISSIEAIKNNSSMVRVYTDNNISFCLPKKRADILEIIEGKEIAVETLDYILNNEVYAAAKEAAVKFLSMKLRTSYEIEQKLTELGYDESTICRVIDNLKEIDYINDYKYAIKYISEKIKLQPKSKNMLSMELNHRGISNDIVSDVFKQIEYDEGEVTLQLLAKKFSKYDSIDDKIVIKMKTFLLSRGYNYEQVASSIRMFMDTKS